MRAPISSSVKSRIFAANFDLPAWLDATRLLAHPSAGKKTLAEVPAAAKIRGTQALRMPAAIGTAAMQGPAAAPPGTTALSAPSSAAAPAPSAARGTRMLSIGLPSAPLRPPTQAVLSMPTWLERGAERIPLTRAVTTLGSSNDADVRLPDARVAPSHAQLIVHAGDVFVRDLGSHGGTWLNGAPLSQERRLSDGDRLQLGPELLVFRGNGARPATPRKPTAWVSAPRLLVHSGSKVGFALRLSEYPLGIGHDPALGLCLSDAGVAKEHARVQRTAAGYVVTALDPATWLRTQPLPPGRAEVLRQGDWLRLGSVDLVYAEDAREEPAQALAPAARLSVDSGPESGRSITLMDGARVGSGPDCQLQLDGLMPLELELTRHGRGFFGRDASGQRTLRAGRPLGSDWVQLEHGDLLMLPGSRLLRFEEQ
ncbi:MAG: FHA domain-containing protein [Polyangiaceae bacterium]